jgi:hypothetical protein
MFEKLSFPKLNVTKLLTSKTILDFDREFTVKLCGQQLTTHSATDSLEKINARACAVQFLVAMPPWTMSRPLAEEIARENVGEGGALHPSCLTSVRGHSPIIFVVGDIFSSLSALPSLP